MAKLFPELVFIRGPQKDTRVVLSRTMNVIGRDKTCDIELIDEYASRQHARIIVEGSRVRLVNTSPNGTRVNGKGVDQVPLNDGDVIGLGLECEIRFEAADSIGPGKPRAAVTAPLPAAKRGAEPAKAEAAPAAPAAESADQAAKPKSRFKKPPAIILVGGYMLFIAALFILLPKLLRTDAVDTSAAQPFLAKQQISDLLKQPPKIEGNLSKEVRKERGLDERAEAIKAFEQWENKTAFADDHLYKTYGHFKMALAYDEAKDFGNELYHPSSGAAVKYKDMMEKVEKALIADVTNTYYNGYLEQRQAHWREADDYYLTAFKMLGRDSANPIVRNILKQRNIINGEIRRAHDRGGPKM